MSRFRRPLAIAVAVAAAAGALAGCGSGKDPQILDVRDTVTGSEVNLAAGTLQIRNVYVTPSVPGPTVIGSGTELVLHAYIFNTGPQPDLLVGALGDTTPMQITPAIGVPVPVHNYVAIGNIYDPVGHPPSATWNTPKSVLVGTSIAVTLRFRNAGTVTINVPIEDGSFASA